MTGKRYTATRVKTAKGRKSSSTRWLQRQLNDPYVKRAKEEGYRSRAAYKLMEMDDKFGFLKGMKRVVDLGAAPGGWTQVARERAGKQTEIVGVDLLEIDPIPGITFFTKDFTEDDAPEMIIEAMSGKADMVMSDMAANTTGHTQTDHVRIIMLCELAYDFAKDILAPEGVFICKVLRGGTENTMLKMMQRDFTTVKHVKPEASRKDSAESYVVAMGFRGGSKKEAEPNGA